MFVSEPNKYGTTEIKQISYFCRMVAAKKYDATMKVMTNIILDKTIYLFAYFLINDIHQLTLVILLFFACSSDSNSIYTFVVLITKITVTFSCKNKHNISC